MRLFDSPAGFLLALFCALVTGAFVYGLWCTIAWIAGVPR